MESPPEEIFLVVPAGKGEPTPKIVSAADYFGRDVTDKELSDALMRSLKDRFLHDGVILSNAPGCSYRTLDVLKAYVRVADSHRSAQTWGSYVLIDVGHGNKIFKAHTTRLEFPELEEQLVDVLLAISVLDNDESAMVPSRNFLADKLFVEWIKDICESTYCDEADVDFLNDMKEAEARPTVDTIQARVGILLLAAVKELVKGSVDVENTLSLYDKILQKHLDAADVNEEE